MRVGIFSSSTLSPPLFGALLVWHNLEPADISSAFTLHLFISYADELSGDVCDVCMHSLSLTLYLMFFSTFAAAAQHY